MKTKLNKIAKAIAVGIFGMALFLNVKVTIEDPFLHISSEALAKTSSSSSSSTKYCFDCLDSNEVCYTVNGEPGPKGTMKAAPKPCN